MSSSAPKRLKWKKKIIIIIIKNFISFPPKFFWWVSFPPITEEERMRGTWLMLHEDWNRDPHVKRRDKRIGDWDTPRTCLSIWTPEKCLFFYLSKIKIKVGKFYFLFFMRWSVNLKKKKKPENLVLSLLCF